MSISLVPSSGSSAHTNWSREDDHAPVHLSQQEYSRQLIPPHNMANATPANTPYRAGHTIDEIPK
jgi:hypothetical protein